MFISNAHTNKYERETSQLLTNGGTMYNGTIYRM